MADPFTGHKVRIDKALVPVIDALWNRHRIETDSSCQGPPLYDHAIICFAEPKGFEDCPDGWYPDDENDEAEVAAYERDVAEWDASRPDGARQVHDLLIRAGHGYCIPRWQWIFGDDPGGANPGSAVLLPYADLPVLDKALRS